MTRTVHPPRFVGSSDSDVAQRFRILVRRRPGGPDRLDAREATIARMFVEGMDERQVAAELCLGAVALRAFLARICAKLDIPSPAALPGVIGKGTSLDFDPRRPAGRVADHGERIDHPRPGRQEVAVDRLMRQGLDDRQIAAALSIGVTTVRWHQATIRATAGAGVADRV